MPRAIRFQPDPLDHALIDFNFENADFKPSAVALILNESYTGCALVTKNNYQIISGQKIKVQVGRLGVLPATIVWGKEIEPDLIQIGIQFLD